MISVVMAYYNRQAQLTRTLISMSESKYRDFNVVIVDDCSPEDIVLPELPFEVKVIKNKVKAINSVPVFNQGFNEALKFNPDVVVIHNPECYHVGDVLLRARDVKEDEYLSFGCYMVDRETSESDYDINEIIINDNHVTTMDENGDWGNRNGWANHPVYDPVAFHYCCALRTENLIRLNGFDERFAFGLSFDDDYLVRQVRNLGLKINITEFPFVVHQWHPNTQKMSQYYDLWKANERVLYDIIPLKEYRAKHLITPDLCGI